MGAFVPDDFVVPVTIDGSGFHLDPPGAEHNERDHGAWMSSEEWSSPLPTLSPSTAPSSPIPPCVDPVACMTLVG